MSHDYSENILARSLNSDKVWVTYNKLESTYHLDNCRGKSHLIILQAKAINNLFIKTIRFIK